MRNQGIVIQREHQLCLQGREIVKMSTHNPQLDQDLNQRPEGLQELENRQADMTHIRPIADRIQKTTGGLMVHHLRQCRNGPRRLHPCKN